MVEDSVTKDRARVYAERGNETQLDWITIGPAGTKLSGNRDKRLRFGEWASEKKWRWGDIGGAGNAGIKDAIGLGWSTLFKSYYLAIKDENFDFSEIDINDCVQSSQALAEKIIDDGKNWTQEFNKLQSTLVERTSNDTEGQKYVDLYKTFEVPVEMNEVMAEGAGDFETKKAMEIVVGRILTEAQKH
ncbi:hypothetical protein ACKAV7_008209 [Fusarium commune]